MTKILVMGAPGAGTSTIGRVVAERFGLSFIDIDDIVWFTEDALRYKRKRNIDHRKRFLIEQLEKCSGWVLSGSICGWGDFLIRDFELVIHLNADSVVRAERIHRREVERYGAELIAPGGDLHHVYEKFQAWAADYGQLSGLDNLRSYESELNWLSKLPCKTLKIDTGAFGVQEVLDKIEFAVNDSNCSFPK